MSYVGSHPVHVRGAVSGKLYAFRHPGDSATIDVADRAGLLRTRLFVVI